MGVRVHGFHIVSPRERGVISSFRKMRRGERGDKLTEKEKKGGKIRKRGSREGQV